MADTIPCPFCREDMKATAVKCSKCQEFLPTASSQRPATPARSIAPDVLTLLGKLAIPVTVLSVALIFKPTLEGLLQRTKQAEFLGTKIAFGDTTAFTGDLTPYELYYLIGSAQNYGGRAKGSWNYDILKRDGKDSIFDNLKAKGLITYTISGSSGDSSSAFGSQGLQAVPTERGKDFLIELGLKYDGKSFTNAP